MPRGVFFLVATSILVDLGWEDRLAGGEGNIVQLKEAVWEAWKSSPAITRRHSECNLTLWLEVLGRLSEMVGNWHFLAMSAQIRNIKYNLLTSSVYTKIAALLKNAEAEAQSAGSGLGLKKESMQEGKGKIDNLRELLTKHRIAKIVNKIYQPIRSWHGPQSSELRSSGSGSEGKWQGKLCCH